MAAILTDGTFTTAAAHGSYRVSFPIEGDTTAQVIEQDFIIKLANFSPLALNTAHATVSSAYLVGEGPLQDLGGGLVQWTRMYATKPADRDEYETFNYRFPGLWDAAGNPPYNQYWTNEIDGGRDPFVDTAVSRLRYQYYRCWSGGDYNSPDLIPILQGLEFTLVSNDQARMDYLFPEGQFLSDSSPSREDWEALIAGGTGIGSGSAAGEFIAEDSRVERYMGNIFVRITRYVKAK